MTNEFVRITPPESIYAEKNLLYSELEVLTASKHLIEYRALKDEENKLKIMLKQRLKNLIELLKLLDKYLPKVKMPEEEKIIDKIEEDSIETNELETELERIKNKLSALQVE